MSVTRTEYDSLGPVSVPLDALWGAHTQRAIENFVVSGTPVGHHRHLVRALGLVKAAAAMTNWDLGLLPSDIAPAVIWASSSVAAGDVDEAFVVDVVQGGAGTSINMNANEVIANLALRSLGVELGRYDLVHPIEHVNKCQSTNDVFPTAVRLALTFVATPLIESLRRLADAFDERAAQFSSVSKVGRTQLQDAVSMTLGQEFGAFAEAIREDIPLLIGACDLLRECNLGSTAIGTGITADPRYRVAIVQRLADVAGVELQPARDKIEATWDTGAFVNYSGVLKRIATKLSKISSDLRLLSSGPERGFAEIVLPARQAGSSIMPGKINPVIPEMVNQIAFFAMGADVTVTIAAEQGQLQLNAFEPCIAHSILQTAHWITGGARALADQCVAGIEVGDSLRHTNTLTQSEQATILVSLVGFDEAGILMRDAAKAGVSAIDLALERGMIDVESANAALAIAAPLA